LWFQEDFNVIGVVDQLQLRQSKKTEDLIRNGQSEAVNGAVDRVKGNGQNLLEESSHLSSVDGTKGRRDLNDGGNVCRENFWMKNHGIDDSREAEIGVLELDFESKFVSTISFVNIKSHVKSSCHL